MMRFCIRETECNFGQVRLLAAPKFSYWGKRQGAGCRKTGPVVETIATIVNVANGSSTYKLKSPYHFLAASAEIHYVVEADGLCN